LAQNRVHSRFKHDNFTTLRVYKLKIS